MNIEIYDAINKIGGNKIFISSDNDEKQFLFDFGLSFVDNSKYYADFMKPRKFNGIVDYLYLKLIPSVDKIYRNDAVEPFSEFLKNGNYKINVTDENRLDGFFLSHAHLDHYNFAGFLKRETPFHMNWITHALLNYIDESSLGGELGKEIINYYDLFKMLPKKRASKKGEDPGFKRATKRDYNDDEAKRPISIIEDGVPLTYKTSKNEIKITSYNVDHSIPGACSYIIEQDGRSIVYTGDFRLHGLHRDWVEDFLKVAKKSNPVAVVTEGTRIPNSKKYLEGKYSVGLSEEEVQEKAEDLLIEHQDLALINFPIKNLDRFIMFYNLAKKCGRKFAISSKMYHYISMIKKYANSQPEKVKKKFLKDYPIPSPKDEHLAVYLRRMKWGKFEEQDYTSFEKDIFRSGNYVTYKDIRKNQHDYLMYMNYWMLNELIDLDPKPGKTLFINSMTDPFNLEMELQDDRLNEWLHHFGINKTETIHSSGHANAEHLKYALEKINAENIIPIHTEHPKTFTELGLGGKIIFPVKGKIYNF